MASPSWVRKLFARTPRTLALARGQLPALTDPALTTVLGPAAGLTVDAGGARAGGMARDPRKSWRQLPAILRCREEDRKNNHGRSPVPASFRGLGAEMAQRKHHSS